MKFTGNAEPYELYFDSTNSGKAYSSNDEYLCDIRALLDLYIDVALKLRNENRNVSGSAEMVKSFSFRGIVITDDEVESIVIASQRKNREGKVSSTTVKSVKRAWEHLESRTRETTNVRLPMAEFFECHKLSLFEKLCILIGLAVELDRKYERLFAYIQDDNTAKLPTYGLALALTLITEQLETLNIYKTLNNSLVSTMLMDMDKEKQKSSLMIEISLRRRVVSLFIGDSGVDLATEKFVYCCSPLDTPEDLVAGNEFNDFLLQTVESLLNTKIPNKLIHIWGEEGAGKKFHVQHVAKKLGTPVVFVDFAYLLSVGLDRAIYLAGILAFEVIFKKLICLYNVNVAESDMAGLGLIFDMLFGYDNLVFVLNNSPKFPISNYSRYKPFVDLEVKPLNLAERLQMWNELSKKHTFQGAIDFKNIANKFNYTAGQMKTILQKAKVLSCGKIKSDALTEVCKTFSVHNLEKKAVLINCKYTFDDLVIDEGQKKVLMDACNYIKYKDIVYESWDFGSKVAYGRGLSMVFYGPPGTGKTMGAQVVANELDLQLYKVDVSQIMNKYVGETEKNLKDIFAEAKTSNSILLFDEADSLFGKRTDVKSSNDKFSNNEISFLLQQMEEYNGVSILTTNKFNHFDDAFRRRIKFVVNFPAPSIEMRKLLWEKVFPQKAPLCSDFDALTLAEKFDLNGSSIKSIAVLAAYSAAGKNEKITMNLIFDAIRYEYQKLGKIVPAEIFDF
ncbi:ATPase AAA [Clostridia bacterium]|nr:ATPase AAA [Clostridia bacterium]